MARASLTGSTQDKIDEAIRDFLRNKVNSFIKWDLVRFFHDNPHTRDTAENIARYTGRDVAAIEDELNGLVQVKVLNATEVSGLSIYELYPEEKTRKLIDRFMTACHDRQFRVKAIHHLIEGMRFSSGQDF